MCGHEQRHSSYEGCLFVLVFVIIFVEAVYIWLMNFVMDMGEQIFILFDCAMGVHCN